MNLDKLITIAAGVVLAFSLTMNLDKIQTLIWRAQAKLIYESRTETWGSPRFFPVTSKIKSAKVSDQITKSKK
ncbi:MAG: hypothetical protein BroJett040_06130 [Oligoflexia bacterium]|nr:MAG: hypothetical protein BroJett040_06130 [Oligoflexia bacterium]